MQDKKYILVKAKPFISIITLNWNQTDSTCQFLETTKALLYKNYEILVCDLGSAVDPTAQILSGNYPNTLILKSENSRENAINLAVRKAKGDFILLVNNHTELCENTLDHLLTPFLSDHSLGVTCPKIRSYYNRKEIHYAGYSGLNIFTGKKSIVGYRKEDNGQFDVPLYTQGVYSGAMMIRKNVIEQPGMLPANFFVYFDDSDLSARILKSGYKILYQPKAVVYNKAQQNTSGKTAIEVFYHTRNRIQFMCSNSGILQLFAFLLTFLFITVPVTSIQFLIKRQIAHLHSFYKAIWWNIKKRAQTFA